MGLGWDIMEGATTASMLIGTARWGAMPRCAWLEMLLLIHLIASFMYHTMRNRAFLMMDLIMVRVIIMARAALALPVWWYGIPILCIGLRKSSSTMMLLYHNTAMAVAAHSSITVASVLRRGGVVSWDHAAYTISFLLAGACWYAANIAREKRTVSLNVMAFHILLGIHAVMEETHYPVS